MRHGHERRLHRSGDRDHLDFVVQDDGTTIVDGLVEVGVETAQNRQHGESTDRSRNGHGRGIRSVARFALSGFVDRMDDDVVALAVANVEIGRGDGQRRLRTAGSHRKDQFTVAHDVHHVTGEIVRRGRWTPCDIDTARGGRRCRHVQRGTRSLHRGDAVERSAPEPSGHDGVDSLDAGGGGSLHLHRDGAERVHPRRRRRTVQPAELTVGVGAPRQNVAGGGETDCRLHLFGGVVPGRVDGSETVVRGHCCRGQDRGCRSVGEHTIRVVAPPHQCSVGGHHEAVVGRQVDARRLAAFGKCRFGEVGGHDITATQLTVEVGTPCHQASVGA